MIARILQSTARLLPATFLIFAITTRANTPVPRLAPPSKQESLDALQTQEGLRVSLAACEPHVVDPISMRFDDHGRMWVVEMRDYPTGPPNGTKPDGRIVVLTDSNRDGVFETSVTFASGLVFPTGLQPWRDGVIVTLAGKIEYMADTDGDLECDQREVWFEGFTTGNEQLRANHPVLGPDGLVYVAGGLRGGEIVSRDPRWPMDRSVDIGGKDFAFDPAAIKAGDGFFSGVAGNSQFGLSIDDFGHRIGCSNRNPAIEALISLDDLSRSRWPTSMRGFRDVSPAGSLSDVRPITKAWTTSNLHASQFSAACGVTRGLGNAMPPNWRNDLVVCEPTGYLVQRQRLSRTGVGHSGQRAGDQRELLASSHPWFRPVDTTVGPDGALYVIDMCRAVIEHPEWVPPELEHRTDERDGNDLGRIWRLTSSEAVPVASQLRPSGEASLIIDWLSHENPHQRETATRLIAEDSNDQATQARLRDALRRPATSAEGFARAFQILSKMNGVDDAEFAIACRHPNANVRRVAARLLRRMPVDHDAWQHMRLLLKDADDWVRWEAVGTASWLCNQNDNPKVVPTDLLANAISANEHTTNKLSDSIPWLVRAETLPPTTAARVAELLLKPRNDSQLTPIFIHRIARQAALAQPASGPLTVAFPWQSAGHSSGQQLACVSGFADGLKKVGKRPIITDEITDVARRVVVDAGASPTSRQQALSVLLAAAAHCDDEFHFVATHDGPTTLRLSAITSLLHTDPDATLAWLRSEFVLLPTELRVAVIRKLVTTSAWSNSLLDWIESETIPSNVLPPDQFNRLTRHPDKNIRDRASRLLMTDRADRKTLIASYAAATKGFADTLSGKTLFTQHCAACHRIDGVGTDVGPDISDSRSKTPESILVAILDPSGAVDAGFACYRWLTIDGAVNTGIMLQSDASRITMQISGGEQQSIERDELDEFSLTGASLMPEGFERVLSVDQMRDLIGYLKAWRYHSDDQQKFDLTNAN